MQPEVRIRLQHVLEAGEKVQRVTAGKTFTDYVADELLPSAVERLFTIIGEALREAYRIDPTIADRITEFRRIIDFETFSPTTTSGSTTRVYGASSSTTFPVSSPKSALCSKPLAIFLHNPRANFPWTNGSASLSLTTTKTTCR
jgi:Uncharacterized conserved protein